MIGLTFDDASKPNRIVEYLATFEDRPTVRLICDEPGSGFDWDGMKRACQVISPVADIMIEVCDSYFLKNISLTEMAERTKKVVDMFGPYVKCVEIGNEIGGDWLGDSVFEKVETCRKMVPDHLKTAITWYYDGNDDGKLMFETAMENEWIADWHLISWYPNWGVKNPPRWEWIFAKLCTLVHQGTLFGFGEFGEEPKKYTAAQKVQMIRDQYALDYPGNFYWNAMDALNKKQVSVLNALRGK